MIIFILNNFSFKILHILIYFLIEFLYQCITSILKFFDHFKDVFRHWLNTCWIFATTDKLFLNQKKIKNIIKIILYILLFYIMRHYKIEEIFRRSLDELLFSHVIVVSLR